MWCLLILKYPEQREVIDFSLNEGKLHVLGLGLWKINKCEIYYYKNLVMDDCKLFNVSLWY